MPASGPPGPASLLLANMSSHFGHSTPLGLPCMCSGHTPIVVPVRKLGGCCVSAAYEDGEPFVDDVGGGGEL
jgi:hypothetical protein